MMKIVIFLLFILSALVALCKGRSECSNVNPCKNGGVCKKSDGICHCPPTYFGELCELKNECHPKCPGDSICVRRNNKTVCERFHCSPIADIVLIFDCSGSISQSEFKLMIQSVMDFVMNFDIGADKIQFSVLAFNDFVFQNVINLKDFQNKLSFLKELKKYENNHPGGGTRTDRALNYLRNHIFTKDNGDRTAAPNIALIFTDGKSNRANETREEVRKLRDTDIHVISIGIGDKINVEELKLIATKEDGVFFTNFTELPLIMDPLFIKVCNTSINPCNKNPCENGGKCRPFLTEYICDCVHPFVGINCEKKCDISADIMIAIDESGSISQRHFNKIIDAVMFFIKTLDITNSKVRIGIITFAMDVFVHYDLDAFKTKLDMLFVTNLLRYQFKGGPTFTHKALRYLRKFSFTLERGDRMKYPNYVLFFSDGKSTFPWLTKQHADKLLGMGVTVYAIGVGRRVKRRELYYIASRPKRFHMILTSFIRLELAMKRAMSRVCKDLKPRPPCIVCRNKYRCPSGMKCCNRCCQDTVNILICPTCSSRYQCGRSKHCFWPFSICWKGCCRTRRYVNRVRCKSCKKKCPRGLKCCRGCCVKPIILEVGCMGSSICKEYPAYKKCGRGRKCCKKCSYSDRNYISGFGEVYKRT